jgi:hypothetical protein
VGRNRLPIIVALVLLAFVFNFVIASGTKPPRPDAVAQRAVVEFFSSTRTPVRADRVSCESWSCRVRLPTKLTECKVSPVHHDKLRCE